MRESCASLTRVVIAPPEIGTGIVLSLVDERRSGAVTGHGISHNLRRP
ncbi:MAG: hypothetical protein V4579_12745 [Pseudomonadota bacterium]